MQRSLQKELWIIKIKGVGWRVRLLPAAPIGMQPQSGFLVSFSDCKTERRGIYVSRQSRGTVPARMLGQETEERVGTDVPVSANPKSRETTDSLQGWHLYQCPVFHSGSPFNGLVNGKREASMEMDAVGDQESNEASLQETPEKSNLTPGFQVPVVVHVHGMLPPRGNGVHVGESNQKLGDMWLVGSSVPVVPG